MNDLVGGHVDFFCEQAVSVAAQITSGAIKAYAVSSERAARGAAERADREGAGRRLPDEHLGRHFRAEGHAAGDHRQARRRARQGARTIPSVQKRLAELGGSIPAKDERTPAKFDGFVKAEIARWSPILKAANTDAK